MNVGERLKFHFLLFSITFLHLVLGIIVVSCSHLILIMILKMLMTTMKKYLQFCQVPTGAAQGSPENKMNHIPPSFYEWKLLYLVINGEKTRKHQHTNRNRNTYLNFSISMLSQFCKIHIKQSKQILIFVLSEYSFVRKAFLEMLLRILDCCEKIILLTKTVSSPTQGWHDKLAQAVR